MRQFIYIVIVLSFSVNSTEFNSFYSAKKHLSKQINVDTKTIYCGCSIKKQKQLFEAWNQ
jgi:deoxyribonuclease-1